MLQVRSGGLGRTLPCALATIGLLVGCASDGVVGDDGNGSDPDAAIGGGPDVEVPATACNMTGRWIVEQYTVSTALNADQTSLNWFYYDITQSGDRFTIERGLNCGFVVDGTTTVTLNDDTLSVLARDENAGPGRQGTFAEINGGSECQFDLDRTYNLRGADKAQYLLDHWTIGDAPKPLDQFPELPDAPPGMEDWDNDGMDGITLQSGLGERYVAQRDWNAHSGVVPAFATSFGGDGVIVVKWDTQEAVSDQTSPILRIGATPKGDGWARYARVDDQLEVVETGANPELGTCRRVQQLASQTWP